MDTYNSLSKMVNNKRNTASSSSSSSCEAAAIIVLIILSLYGGSAPKQQKNGFGLLQSGGPGHKCVDGLSLNDFLGQLHIQRQVKNKADKEFRFHTDRQHETHTPSAAFRHLPPNSARFSYATEGALFISAQLSGDVSVPSERFRY